MDGSFFNIIMLAISLYVLYAGIVGKGRLYQADNIKEECKEKFHSILRKVFIGLGVVMLLMSACNFAPSLFYTQNVSYSFSEDYTDSDGNQYKAGTPTTAEELTALMQKEAENAPASSSSGGMCAPAASSSVPYTYDVDYEAKYPAFEKISYRVFNIAGTVLMGLSVLTLVALFIIINKMTDKEKKKEQREKAQQNVSAMPSDAFNFDEEQ